MKKKCPSDLKKYECPKCRNKKWFKNPTTEMMFCRVCGYVIGDLKNECQGTLNQNR
jgi:ribosomal protein S27E